NALGAVDETFPLEAASSNNAPTAQKLTCMLRYYRAGMVLTGITIPVLVQATGMTYARSCVYRHSTSGLVANSNDMTGTLNSAGTGKFNLPFSSAYLVPVDGLYWVGFLFDGGTSPSIACSAPGGGAPYAARPGASWPLRVGIQTGQASLP